MTLYLLPNLLAQTGAYDHYLPGGLHEIVPKLDGLIAESPKPARPFLKHYLGERFREFPIASLNEHTRDDKELLAPLLRGETWGLISDCGIPCVADPGARIVAKAHKAKIEVIAYPGPSAIIQTLMLSGFSAQAFTFHGYLAKKPDERKKQLQKMRQGTHLFIEAPYRSKWMFDALLENLPTHALLCVCADLTLPSQIVRIGSINDFRKNPLTLEKQPTVFAISL